jgi:hypothetical protein
MNDLEDVEIGKLEKAEVSEEDIRKYEENFEKSSWKKFKAFGKRVWNGNNKFGKYVGLGLDISESFAPKWISSIRDIFQSKPKQKPMTSKAETFLQTVLRFLKQKSTRRGAATLVAILGAIFGLDIDSEILMKSLIGIVTGASAIVAGVYGVLDVFRDEE